MLGPSVAIPAHLIAGLTKLAHIGADEVKRRDGVTVDGELGELLENLKRIASVPLPASLDPTISAVPEIASGNCGNDSTLVDVGGAAVVIGTTESRVRQLLRSGLLGGTRERRTWILERSEVERYAAERRKSA